MLNSPDKSSSIAFLHTPKVQTLARCATASTIPADDDKHGAHPCFELTCSAYQLKGAMLGFGAQGSIYKLSCRQLTAADLEGLTKAAESSARVRLVFPDGQIVLSNIKLQRLGDGWTGIEGRLVGTRTSGSR